MKSYEELGKQVGYEHDMEDCMLDSLDMTYGRVCGMLNWCHAQGTVDPPWEILNFRGFKIWWLLPVALIMILGGIKGGQDTETMTVLGILLTLILIFLSLRVTLVKHNKKGRCVMCKDPVHEDYEKKSLRIRNWRGKTVKVSSSTYCKPCAINTDRQTIWRDIEDMIWQMIVKTPVKGKTWWRILLYSLPWPINAREEFNDPREIGQKLGSKYKRGDRMNPKDRMSVKELIEIRDSVRLSDKRLTHYIDSIERGQTI